VSRADRNDRYQGGEQTVFEQVLSVILDPRGAESTIRDPHQRGDCYWRLHGSLSSFPFSITNCAGSGTKPDPAPVN
jgi:hypothetical protein